jgi:hypothetical protein
MDLPRGRRKSFAEHHGGDEPAMKKRRSAVARGVPQLHFAAARPFAAPAQSACNDRKLLEKFLAGGPADRCDAPAPEPGAYRQRSCWGVYGRRTG